MFAHLIKGTVLGRALWDVNTFPTHNRLPNPKSGFSQTLSYLFDFSIVFQNKLWWRLHTLYFFKFNFLVRRLVAISVATDFIMDFSFVTFILEELVL